MSQWITDRLPTREDATERHVWHWCEMLNQARIRHYTHLRKGDPWMPFIVPEAYVKPTRFTVVWYHNVQMWGVKDSQDDGHGLQSNFETKEAAERVAAVYNEVLQ